MPRSRFFRTYHTTARWPLWTGLLIAMCIILCLHPPAALAQDSVGKRLALVIGNDAYKNVVPLNNARNDARLMAATLKKANFEVTQANDLGREALWQTIDAFRSRIQKGDEIVFYFAGHGVQIKSNQLLLPVDIKASNDAQVQRDGIALVDVQDALKDARFALLVLDACRDNPFPPQGTRTIGGGTRGLLPPEPVTGQAIVMSAGRNQKALDSVPGISQANGLFTWELAQVLQTPGVEIRTALESVKDRVDDKAKGAGHEQRPSIVSDLRGNFYFFGATTVQVQNAAATPESEAWAAARQAHSISAYQAYLEAFPKGRYAVAAKIALDTLKTPAPTSATRPPPPSTSATPTKGEDAETSFWNEVKGSGAREYLDAYVKQYPKGKYLALARIELKKLDDSERAERARQAAEQQQAQEQERQSAQRAEQSAWENAKAGNRTESYAVYLGSYPQGRYAALAQAAQQKLQREAAEAQSQEAQRVGAQQRKQREEDERAVKEIRPEKVFKDCADCPEMVAISAGSFTMGSSAAEQARANTAGLAKNFTDRENPQHSVSIKAVSVGKTELTRGQFAAFVAASGHNAGNSCYVLTGTDWKDTPDRNWRNPGFAQTDNDPVVCVNWDDAQAYVRWLSQRTGKSYRLPSEAEWEYACRAGANQTYCGSDTVDSVAVYGRKNGDKTLPVGEKQANAWGLYDMSGNVWEWTQDCWNDSYSGAPSDGSPWTTGTCGLRVQRGGAWDNDAANSRAAFRDWSGSSFRDFSLGFRLARMLP